MLAITIFFLIFFFFFFNHRMMSHKEEVRLRCCLKIYPQTGLYLNIVNYLSESYKAKNNLILVFSQWHKGKENSLDFKKQILFSNKKILLMILELSKWK